MDLKNQLLKEHSSENARHIADYFLQNPEGFEKLINTLNSKEPLLAQRAAWAVGKIGEQRPEWFIPHFPLIVQLLESPLHDSVSRNIYRTLQELDIPEEYEGEILELTLRDLEKADSSIAIKVFAMTVAAGIAKKHPELSQEISMMIEDQLPYGSAGYRSRAKKILKQLKKM